MIKRAVFWFRYWVIFGGFLVSVQTVLAQPKGLLPSSEGAPGTGQAGPSASVEAELGRKIRDGEVKTGDIPAIILHMVDFFLMIAGGISVIMILVGGVQLIIGGLTENKESGKKTLQYAILGLFVSFLSWFAVDQIQRYLTAEKVYEDGASLPLEMQLSENVV